MKFKCWALANGYNPFKCKLLFRPECVAEGDFLLVIYVGNFTSFLGKVVSKSLASYLNKSKGKIVLNVNHYPYHPSSGSQSIRSLDFHYFWAENDLRKNSGYFRKHFGDFNELFIVAPFAVRSKFTCTTKFNLRLVKVVAV